MWRHDGDNCLQLSSYIFSLKLSSYILRILQSKFVSFSLSVLNDGYGGGYLSGEDERGGHGGVDAAADRDGGVVLTEDEGGVHVDGVGREDSDSGQDSVSLETVEDSFSGGGGGG